MTRVIYEDLTPYVLSLFDLTFCDHWGHIFAIINYVSNPIYDALVIATGIELAFDQIEGAQDALENDPRCVSNYSPVFVNNTYPAIQSFTGGNAVFTQPPQSWDKRIIPRKMLIIFII